MENEKAIRIDPEFKGIIPPLQPEEREQLEKNIIAEGCRDPLVLWGDILVDGHNRYDICQAHGITFKTVSMEFASREDAMDWMDANQLGRRNINPEYRALVVGRRYNRAKKAAHCGKNQYTIGGEAQSEPHQNTAEQLADEYGVSRETVKRAGQFAAAVEKLADVAPDLPKAIAAGDAPSRKDIVEAASVVEANPEQAKAIIEGKKPHVCHNSGENEWYTPATYIESACVVMGTIDLDPASSALANGNVQAKRFFSIDDNGLAQDWRGNVWMNPPYSKDLIGKFCVKLVEEFNAGMVDSFIVLVNNATETEWFNALVSVSSCICFPRGRIRFESPSGEKGAPLQGQAFLYGAQDNCENIEAFIKEFKSYGFCAVVR